MFRALAKGSLIEATAHNIVSIHRSLNNPDVSLEGGEPDPCRAHVLGVYNLSGDYSLYVILTSVARSCASIFQSSQMGIPISGYRTEEDEALELVRRHGFVMERIELSNISDEDRGRLTAELPLRLSSSEKVSRNVVPPQARSESAAVGFELGLAPEEAIALLGRLLVSF